MDALLVVTLVALATHRLTLLVVEDEILARPRLAVQNRFERAVENRTGTVNDDQWQSRIAYLLSCPWCMSIWIGGVVVLGAGAVASVPLPVLTWLAASSVTGLLGGQHRGR